MNIVEYFNPHDINHIRAYQHLQHGGTWPTQFYANLKENGIDLPANWQLDLAVKMSNAWIEHMDIAHIGQDNGC